MQRVSRQLTRLQSRIPTSTRRFARCNHNSPTPPPTIPSSSRIQRYLPRLQALADRTGVPLSSLAVSFLILHELTAVLPVIGFYFIFSSLGTGLGIIECLNRTTGEEETGWRSVVSGWYDEGQNKIGRVGRRYGLWQDTEQASGGSHAGEGVANAVAAYVVVKVDSPLSQAARNGRDTKHTGLVTSEDRSITRRKPRLCKMGIGTDTKSGKTLDRQESTIVSCTIIHVDIINRYELYNMSIYPLPVLASTMRP
jgi:hypothetical protein